ncbi:hypothetical protein Hanom_Chr05g00476501 [Helianthus anomalus]
MQYVGALIAKRQWAYALIGIGLNCCVLGVLYSRFDAKLLSSQESHWKQLLYSYGVEISLSTSYPTHTLP